MTAGRTVRCRDDAGAAVPFVLMCVGLLLLVGLATGWVSAVVVAHRETQAAADLAALAGATALQQGGAGCPRAAEIAARNDAGLVRCVVSGRTVRVEVQRRGPALAGRRPQLGARARAGPVGCPECPVGCPECGAGADRPP